MATLCKNCSHALVFNPASQKLECSYCGSSFTAEEVESESKEYRQDLQAESMETVYGETDGKYMDCYVYTCAECGGEIIINGSESSTTCIFCLSASRRKRLYLKSVRILRRASSSQDRSRK